NQLMRRTVPVVPAALIILLAANPSCSTRTPTAPESGGDVLPAPAIARAQCGVTMKWPDAPLTLAWQPVARASTYTVEVDCDNCGSRPDPWFSRSGTPWH